MARDIGIDRLLGGTQVEAVPEILAGSAVHYLPFPGAPFEHPAKLAGSPVQVGRLPLIGSAAFDGSFAPRLGCLRSQLRAVLEACG